MRKIAAILTVIGVIIVCVFVFNNLSAVSYEPIVRVYAEQNNVSLSLILAIIKVESNFKTDAVSSAGAIGLMQIMPATSAWIASAIGVENKPEDPLLNIAMGTWYMGSYLLPKYNGDEDKALMAYNAGEGNVGGWNDGEIPFSETENYLKRVKWWRNLFDIYLKMF